MFTNCFTSVIKKDVIDFVVDERKFYNTMNDLFTKEAVRKISREYLQTVYTYNSETNTFYQINDSNLSDSKNLIAIAKNNLINMTPIYMNGKYVHPRIIDFDKDNKKIDDIKPSIHPFLMKELMSFILMKLTDNLEKYDKSNRV